MRVTIITIAYNSSAVIATTIESVLAQTYNDMEYLIIDGASRDNTVQIAESYRSKMEKKGIEYKIYSEPDEGIYDAMNKGIGLAQGDIIGILNSGDLYESIAVETAAETFQNTGCELMFADICIVRTNGSVFVKKARQRKIQTSRDWNHPTTFVKGDIIKAFPFRKLGIHDDYGFYLQMRKQGRYIVTVPKVLAKFYLGGTSNQKSFRAAWKRVIDRYKYCYRINGYSRFYIIECFAIEAAKMILG